jgi:hypothetical protein
MQMSVFRKDDFDRASAILSSRNAAQDPSKRLPEYMPRDCFETLRLSINQASARDPLTTSHRSSYIFVTFFGSWTGGELDFEIVPICRVHV